MNIFTNWAPGFFWRSTYSVGLRISCIVVLCTVYCQNPSSRDWTRCIKSAKDITGPSMATDRKSWQRVVWLLLPSLYVAGIIIDINMNISLLWVGTTAMYMACVLVAICWILAVALAVMMDVCVHFWQLFLGIATSLPWICSRHFHFIQHIHSLVFLVTTCPLQLMCTPLSSPCINQKFYLCFQFHSICMCHFFPPTKK